jgi:hypothetical protein
LTGAAVIPAECRNCGTFLGEPPGNFCPGCGQDTSPHAPAFLEFAHEFVGHYVALEGRLWRTLAKLFFMPGELTREYLRGRKQRYVLPLRLYLTASFIFFVLVKFVGGDTSLLNASVDGNKVLGREVLQKIERKMAEDQAAMPPGAADAEALETIRKATAKVASAVDANKAALLAAPDGPASIGRCDDDSRPCAFINEHMKRRFGGMTQAQAIHDVKSRMQAMAPYAIFLMLPFYAALMKLAYLRRTLTYGEHIVFALHLHAFLFFLLLLETVLPTAIDRWMPVLAMVYGAVAMQRTYGGRWWANLLRYGAVGTAYLCLITLVALAVVLGAVFF